MITDPYFLAHTSVRTQAIHRCSGSVVISGSILTARLCLQKATVTLDPCTVWTHVDVGTGPQYPAPRFSNMVPTTHTTPSHRFDGSLPIGGNATVPEYHDDEFKALRPQDCAEDLFRTTLHDPVTDFTTVLHHQSSYLQVWTGALSTFGIDVSTQAICLCL